MTSSSTILSSFCWLWLLVGTRLTSAQVITTINVAFTFEALTTEASLNLRDLTLILAGTINSILGEIASNTGAQSSVRAQNLASNTLDSLDCTTLTSGNIHNPLYQVCQLVETQIVLQLPQLNNDRVITDFFYSNILPETLQRINNNNANTLQLNYLFPKVVAASMVVNLDGVNAQRKMMRRERDLLLLVVEEQLVPLLQQPPNDPNVYQWQDNTVVTELVSQVLLPTMSNIANNTVAAQEDPRFESLFRNQVLLQMRAHCQAQDTRCDNSVWEEVVLETATNYTSQRWQPITNTDWRTDLANASSQNFVMTDYFTSLRSLTVANASATTYISAPTITLAVNTVELDPDIPAFVWTLLALCLTLLAGASGYTVYAVRTGRTVDLLPAEETRRLETKPSNSAHEDNDGTGNNRQSEHSNEEPLTFAVTME